MTQVLLFGFPQCRLECQYAFQQDLDMIPLMLQKDFKPKGWLGLILGTRMWYRAFSPTSAAAAAIVAATAVVVARCA